MTDSNAEILVEISKDLEDLIPEYIDSMNTSIEYIEGLVKSNNLVEVKSEAHKTAGIKKWSSTPRRYCQPKKRDRN